MNETTARCVYVFTAAEYGAARACQRRYGANRWLYLFMVVVVVCAVAFAFIPDSSHHPASPQTPLVLVLNAIPVVIFAGFIFYAISYKGTRAFKKSALYDKNVELTLHETGVALRTPIADSNISWEAYSMVIEGPTGFLLYQKGNRVFNWLPKSGFSSPESVGLAREILRRHVPDAKKLFAAGNS